MTLEPFQAEYRGLVFGEGTDVLWDRDVSGLRHMVVESNSQALSQSDGYAASPHYVRPPRAVFSLRVMRQNGETDAELEARLASVEATFTRQRDTAHYLTHRLAGPERAILVRPVEREVPLYPGMLASGAPRVVVALERSDPYIYGTTIRSVTVPIYQVSGGGIDFPWDFPLNFGAPSGLEGVAVNAGDATAWPLIRVQLPAASVGEVDGFTLLNVTTGDEFEMVVDLTAGQILVADMGGIVRAEAGPNIAIDGSSRSGGWQHPRVPWGLIPGSNTVRLSIDGTATDVTASITYRDTSL